MLKADLDNLPSILEDLKSSKIIAVDTETTGLEWKDRPFAIIMATKNNEYYFAEPFNKDFIGAALNFDCIYAFQNAKFDMRMLRHIGLEVGGKIIDINILARAIDNTHIEYSLEAQAKRAGFSPKLGSKIKDIIKKNGLYSTRRDFFGEEYKNPQYNLVPETVMMEYACHDGRLTYDLCESYLAELATDERVQSILETEFKLTRVCFEMEWRGVHLDIKEVLKQLEESERGLQDLYRRFEETTNERFDNKPSTLARVFGRAGETFVYTEKGRLSFTDEVLENFQSQAAGIVREIRFFQKRITSFYKPFLNLQSGGVLHPTMWQAGTGSGRFSYSDPNLQQVPKEDGDLPIRACLVPRKGKKFVSIDYKAQEFRMMLAYANQRDLIEKVMAGLDPHQATGDTVKIPRKTAKMLNFMLIYGASYPRVAEALKIPVLEAKALLIKYFMSLPYVDQFMGRVKTTAKSRGVIYTWAGRRLTFTDPSYSYKAPNYLIQGGAADVCKIAMVKLYELGILPVLQVHDQLVFEFDDDATIEDKIKLCVEIMETTFPEKNGIRLEVDVTTSSKSFAERDQTKWLNEK